MPQSPILLGAAYLVAAFSFACACRVEDSAGRLHCPSRNERPPAGGVEERRLRAASSQGPRAGVAIHTLQKACSTLETERRQLQDQLAVVEPNLLAAEAEFS
jgi:hypothetical protein